MDHEFHGQDDRDRLDARAQDQQRRKGAENVQAGMDEAAEMAVDPLRAHLVLGLEHEIAQEVLQLQRQQCPQGQSHEMAHQNTLSVSARPCR
jgi:hypothetical protein